MATAVDGVILIDARGSVLMFNSVCERLFQYRASEVIGQNVKMLMPGPYREEHNRYVDNFNQPVSERSSALAAKCLASARTARPSP